MKEKMAEKTTQTYIAISQPYFASRGDVSLAYLFGSVARGEAGPLSDVDVAVLLVGDPDEEICSEARLDIIGDLMHLLSTNEVDVLILNQSPLALRYAVLRDGVPLFVRSRKDAVDFRIRTLNEYFDFAPMIQKYQRIFFEKIRAGEFLSGYNPYRGTPAADKDIIERFTRPTKAQL
jgi:predicted nucleotidyltransferase